MKIESKDNTKFKNLKKLKLKKYRDQSNEFLVYGETLVNLALEKGIVKEIFTTNPNKKGTVLSKRLMSDLSMTKTDYDVIALCEKINLPKVSDKILMLDDIQDPQNVGALLRSALAFSFDHVILSLKCADIYNDKTIRASGGALFDLYIERTNLIENIIKYKSKGYFIYGADAHQTDTKINKNSKTILILGNEGSGLREEIKSLADGFIKIKTKGVESLNVSVAGSILMYEWSVFR